jgi:DNA-binding XRE family transcriptional regulator
MAGARRETVLFIEKGEHKPPLNLAYAIAKALKTSIDELFLFDDRPGKGGHAHFRASLPFSSL